MGRQRIEHRATTTADPATVYALLRDGASWPDWSPIDSFELERPGADEPEGVGAVRLFRGGRVPPVPRRRRHRPGHDRRAGPRPPALVHARLEPARPRLSRRHRPRARP